MIFWSCDYCGQTIEFGRNDGVTLQLQPSDPRLGMDCLGDYHLDCWKKVWAALELVHEYGPPLETIPTATAQAIAARRRKLTRTEGDG